MSQSIIGITKSLLYVENAVDALQQHGVDPAHISVLIPESGGVPDTVTIKTTKAPEGAATGVVTGGITGGALGLLAGIGALAIPGIGPFIAAGPIVAALSGAAIGAAGGGVVGALVGLGIPELEAKIYEDRIKAGGYLLAVHVTKEHTREEIRETLNLCGLEDISAVTEK